MTSAWLITPLVIVSVLGIIVNAYILLLVLLSRQTATANNLLLLHLGGVDVFLGIIFLSLTAPGLTSTDLAAGEWSILTSGPLCESHGFMFTLLHPMILWTICGLNADRYYAIAAPLHYGHIVSVRKVLICLGVGWSVAFVMSLPPFFKIAPYTFNPDVGVCLPDFSCCYGIPYSTIYTALTFLLPATLIVCCNIKILMIARYHRHRIASAIYEVTLSAQVTITHQRNPFFVPTVTAPGAGGPKFRSRSPVSTVLQLVGSFFIMYLPYYITILWSATATTLEGTPVEPVLYQIVSVLLTASPSVNAFLYGLKNKTLRKTFQNYWRKKLTKSEVNQEIQARTPSTCGSRRQSLTPLGFFTRPTISRRLSEALLDVQRVASSPTKSHMKRIASELTWRPRSTNGLNLSPDDEVRRLPQAASCNTLQVPSDFEEVSFITDNYPAKSRTHFGGSRSTLSSANLFLQKVFGIESSEQKKATAIQTVLDAPPKRSPRILITRAFSEDSDKAHSTDLLKLSQKHLAKTKLTEEADGSTSKEVTAVLLEKKLRQVVVKDPEDEEVEEITSRCTSRLLQKINDSPTESSDGSSASDAIYLALDKNRRRPNEANDIPEGQRLLGECSKVDVEMGTMNSTRDALMLWPKNGNPSNVKWKGRKDEFMKMDLNNVQSQEIIL